MLPGNYDVYRRSINLTFTSELLNLIACSYKGSIVFKVMTDKLLLGSQITGPNTMCNLHGDYRMQIIFLRDLHRHAWVIHRGYTHLSLKVAKKQEIMFIAFCYFVDAEF